jgi:large subunit ribosomal protein L14
MKAISAKSPLSLNLGAEVKVVDNSGARIARIVGVKRGKNRKGRQQACRIADLVKVSIRKGPIEMKKQLFWAVVLRQKKEYKRKTGERIGFEDNAVALLKDEEGNPKGTQIKGPIARETAERWPFIQKIAQYVI